VFLPEDTNLDHVLDYYMGKNTPERQEFIIDNLRVELDIIEAEEEVPAAEVLETSEAPA
jgi:topoisomerase-4 subunit B